MNRKTLLALAAVAATGATFAAVTATSDNILCRIKVTTTTQETMIGLPLVDVRSTDGKIDVKSFVLTEGLPKDTTLQYKNGSTWSGWYLPEASGTWTPVNTTVSSSIQPGSEGSVELARGGCVVLTLPKKPTEALSFYLYGQFVDEKISGLDLSSQGYHLVGNPGTVAVTNIVEQCGITLAANDQVIVPYLATYQDPANGNKDTTIQLLKYCTYDGTKWNRTFTVAPGQGFWYKNAAADTQESGD